MRATRPVSNRAAGPSVEMDELRQGEVDAFVMRNREALDTSIRRSRSEIGKGVQSSRTIDQIVANGRKRHRTGS